MGIQAQVDTQVVIQVVQVGIQVVQVVIQVDTQVVYHPLVQVRILVVKDKCNDHPLEWGNNKIIIKIICTLQTNLIHQ